MGRMLTLPLVQRKAVIEMALGISKPSGSFLEIFWPGLIDWMVGRTMR